MMPRSGSRGRLRTYEACLNCRRKKTRCPAERPVCSNCSRLGQGRACLYTAGGRGVGIGNGNGQGQGQSEDRLASLEEKVNLIMKGSGSGPGSGSGSVSRIHEDEILDPSPSYSLDPFSCDLVPEDSNLHLSSPTIAEAVDLYFQYCHRQPIWCFNHSDLEDNNNQGFLSKELVYSMLTLTTRFSPTYNDNDNECHQLLQFYSNTARTLIMLRVANGTVDLETIESLCLLAYSFFIDGNAFLGRFHLGFAFQLCRSAMIDVQASSNHSGEEGNAHSERKKRLFWSLVSLEQCYGQQEHNLGHPALPRDDNNTGDTIDIWTLAIHFGWVWSRVRTYVSDCAQNKLKEPWRYDSMYAMILSDLTEVENKLSQCHRYDSVKFYARTAEDVLLNRGYWGPWLKLQFSYHCILTMLNHPFLYIVASQHYPNLAIPNAFWRRSSELALLHATWIVRIIDMVSEKKMCLIDPFFGHAAAVAATVHLYYCRAADPRLKFKSKIDLAKCRRFLEGFVSFSPACRALDATLEKILRVAFGSENVDYDWTPSRIYLSVPLMWDILRATPNLPESHSQSQTQEIPGGGGLLHPSLIPTPTTIPEKENNPSTTEPSPSTLEIIVAISPEVTVNTADGGQAAHMPPNMPPTSSSSASQSHQQTTTTPSSPPNLSSSSPSPYNTSLSVDIGGDRLVAPNDHLMMNTPWLWTDPAQVPAPEVGNMNREELESAVGNVDGLLSWWDIGNL